MWLIALSCAWILGIFLGSLYHLPLALISTGLLPVLLIFILKRFRNYLILASLCLIILFSAAFYYPFSLPPTSQTSIFNNQEPVTLKGVISSPPEVRNDYTHIQLSVREINGRVLQGEVLIFALRYPEYRYGDILEIKGRLEDPLQLDGFDYQTYLAQKNILSTMINPQITLLDHENKWNSLDWVYNLRDRLSASLNSALPEPQAALAQGIILGTRSGIPEDLRNDLSISGTAHLLAISGINLTIIAGMLVTLGIWIFGRRYRIYIWITWLCIWFYALITGLQAPVVRSAIMASIFLLAELLGRQKNALPALALSAAVMVGLDTQLLWNISFQLSFLATAGLIFFTPLFQNLGHKAITGTLGDQGFSVRALTLVTDSFSGTLGAIIAIWPIIAFNFGSVSLIGPISTLLIAPALTPIIVLGALTAIAGLINPALAQIIGWTCWLFLSYMLWLVKAFAGLPGASLQTGPVSNFLSWLYYSILGIIVIIKANLKKLIQILPSLPQYTRTGSSQLMAEFAAVPKKFLITPLALAALLTTYAAVTLPDDQMHVSFLDVGEGDATLIQSGNKQILIDGGPDPQAICLELSQKLPFWDRHLDLIVLTHPHLDHLSGLIEVLHRYQVDRILAPELQSNSPAYREWLNLINQKAIPCTSAIAGQQIQISRGAFLEILNPASVAAVDDEDAMEDYGIVAKLNWNQVSFLLTADIGEEAEAGLISRRADLNCTVLKVAHHGSATSTSSNFISIAHPQVSVISVSADNNFGHPDPAVLERLQGTNVYRTDLSGTIEFTTDGETIWVKTER